MLIVRWLQIRPFSLLSFITLQNPINKKRHTVCILKRGGSLLGNSIWKSKANYSCKQQCQTPDLQFGHEGEKMWFKGLSICSEFSYKRLKYETILISQSAKKFNLAQLLHQHNVMSKLWSSVVVFKCALWIHLQYTTLTGSILHWTVKHLQGQSLHQRMAYAVISFQLELRLYHPEGNLVCEQAFNTKVTGNWWQWAAIYYQWHVKQHKIY